MKVADRINDESEVSAPAVQIGRESIVLHEPVTLTCKFRVDPELVLKCQDAGQRPHRGTPLGKMRVGYPFEELKKIAMDETKQFIHYMKIQGNEPRTAESVMTIYGPYREKMDMSKGASMENFEAGNPFHPNGMWRSQAHGVWAPDGKGPRLLDRKKVLDSPDWELGTVYFVQGLFLASHGKEEEETGVLIV